MNADRIIVLKNGRITESRTHQELMRAGLYYASPVERQTKASFAKTVNEQVGLDFAFDRQRHMVSCAGTSFVR